jgi:hypothetical protein
MSWVGWAGRGSWTPVFRAHGAAPGSAAETGAAGPVMRLLRRMGGVVMSHKATNWAIGVRGLKPATKIVLWHLADCHNAQTGVCNPIQATLATLCEMSRASINTHLAMLEERGLIRRIARVDHFTGRQLSTHYLLAVDGDFPGGGAIPESVSPDPEPDSGPQDVVCPVSNTSTRSVSRKPASPCPENRDFRVQNLDTLNPGKEPGREPGKNPHSPPSQKKPTTTARGGGLSLLDLVLAVKPHAGP